MKIATALLLLATQSTNAFLSPSLTTTTPTRHFSLRAVESSDDANNNNNNISRRTLLATSLATSLVVTSLLPPIANAVDDDDAAPSAASATPTVVVAGATGQTGRRILERLAGQPNLSVIAGVRNVEKAEKSLGESSTVVRGAMVQKVPSLDAAGVELRKIDGAFSFVRWFVCLFRRWERTPPSCAAFPR